MDDRICRAAWLGQTPFEEAWRLQEKLAAEIAGGRLNAALLLLEHPHTFTAGRSTREGHVLWDAEERQKRGVDLFDVDRGGDVTYHGPGQLVGYPLIRLPDLREGSAIRGSADTVGYVRKIETVLMQTLAKFGITGIQKPGFTGVWVKSSITGNGAAGDDSKKIASIGVKVDVNRVTRHGFALNVNPDMSYWKGIIACGLPGAVMTSMSECLGNAPDMEEIIRIVIDSFERVFKYKIVLDYKI